MWGDPYDILIEEEDDATSLHDRIARRRELIIEMGLFPGALVTYGQDPYACVQRNVNGVPRSQFVHVWSEPEFGCRSFDVLPGLGTIISIDFVSDLSTNWLHLLFTTPKETLMCWVPSTLVTKAGDNDA